VGVLPVRITTDASRPTTAGLDIDLIRSRIVHHREVRGDHRSHGRDHDQEIGSGSETILLGEDASLISSPTNLKPTLAHNPLAHRGIRRLIGDPPLDTTEGNGRRETTITQENPEQDHIPQTEDRRLLHLARIVLRRRPIRWLAEEDFMEGPTVITLLSRCRLRFP
jgi:hypothetical protein